MVKGWHKDSLRHSMASRGIKTSQKIPIPSARAIPSLNVNRYMGRWYQIKAFPQWFQRGCDKAIAEYEKRKGYIEVKNSCIDKESGKRKFVYAKGYPVNPGKSKLEVDFVGGRIFTGDYWVLYTDYDSALVGSPNKNSLWILSRRPTIAKTQLQKLEQIAKNQGFDITKLKR